MNAKRLLFMQTLSIFPIVGILLIYTQGLVYVIVALILLLLLAVNLYRYKKNTPLLNYPLLIILMLSFFFYAFYNLGTTEVPQTFTTLKKGNSVAFDFSKPVNIDKICYYVGIDKDAYFTLEEFKKEKWKKFYTYEKSFPFSFRWKCIEHELQASKIRLNVTKSQMMLNEIRFLKKDETIEHQSTVKNINDESQFGIDESYYSGMFFDEIYFGRTAYEILNKQTVYENTHPYLGKLLIIPGIKLFGMTPFGWRFTNALFAGILIFMAYYFALQMFREKEYAFVSAFLMTYSFMHLAQARIGLIDTFGVLFVFISYFYLYRFIIKQKLSLLLLSGLFYGLAAAVKWSSVFAALGFIFIALYLLISGYALQKRFSGIKLLLYGILSYAILAPVVYAVSFYDIYLQTASLQSIIDYNFGMYDYHSRLQATHDYSSSWWSWPLNLIPMGYYKLQEHGLLSSINAFGNPAIFWLGIVAILYLVFVIIKRATLEAWFILLAFLGLYLPYIFVGRLMFIYHFYYAVPFLMLAIVYMFKDGMEKSIYMRKFYLPYLFIVAGLFVAFYPVLSGYAVNQMYVDYVLRWLPKWWF